MREIAHVLLHPKRSTFVDDGFNAEDDADSQEVAADNFAAASLLSPAFDEALAAANTRAITSELEVSLSVVAG